MATTDFFAPVFEVLVNGQRLSADVSKNITDVSFTDEPGKLDTFSFTLANPYPEMRWTHDPRAASLFEEGNTVKIKMGYLDDPKLMIEGPITSTSLSFPSSGTPTVAVQGKSYLHKLTCQPVQHTYLDRTDSEIVQEVARRNNLDVDADETSVRHKHVYQNNVTDHHFLLDRARRLDFELTIVGKKLIFRKQEYTKVYTLVWGHPNLDYDDRKHYMPLLDFTPTLNTREQVSLVIVRGQDPETRAIYEGRAGKGDEGHKMGKGKTGAEMAEKVTGQKTTFLLVNQPIRSQQEANAMANAIYKKKAARFITGRGSTIGLPLLRTGQLVTIDGLGFRFNGEYYITQTTHSCGSNGYQTSFSVQRNAINE